MGKFTKESLDALSDEPAQKSSLGKEKYRRDFLKHQAKPQLHEIVDVPRPEVNSFWVAHTVIEYALELKQEDCVKASSRLLEHLQKPIDHF
jgi:hypothetical protein